MTLQDRCDHYAKVFPNPAAKPWITWEQHRKVLYAVWVIGNDYRNKTAFYGAYPAGFLARVMALFPDAVPTETLHAFSGSLPAGPYARCDLVQPAELQCNVYDLPPVAQYRLIIADPPYTPLDAQRYGTPGVDRRRATAALAGVAYPGAFLCWLDCTWPMHRKAQWETIGRILVQRSTNHRVRLLSIFRRTA